MEAVPAPATPPEALEMRLTAFQLAVRETLETQATRLATLEASLARPAPLEPLYDRAQAELLIPCSHAALERWLRRGALPGMGPPLYRYDAEHRSRRLLRLSDLHLLRAKMVRPTIGHRQRPRPAVDLISKTPEPWSGTGVGGRENPYNVGESPT